MLQDCEIIRNEIGPLAVSDANGSRNSEACSSGRYYVLSRARNQCPKLLCNMGSGPKIHPCNNTMKHEINRPFVKGSKKLESSSFSFP